MGKTKESDVARVTERLLQMGCYEVSLGDTTGQGTPVDVHTMLEAVLAATGNDPKLLAVHFHDTL
jgi:hydroxymethylglutaryl-CoA lyase